MLAGLRHVLTSPLVGPVATGAALMLAVAFGVSAANWREERAEYEARLAQLTRTADQAEERMVLRLASCQRARQPGAASEADPASMPSGARTLLARPPDGIDACARMESADRAVLASLRR